MCVEYKPCRTYPFYMVTLRRLSIFHYFECNPIEKKRKEKKKYCFPILSERQLPTTLQRVG